MSRDVTKGAEALVASPPSVVIEGRTYQMRRLGAMDVIKWLQMIRSSGTRGVRAVVDLVNDLKLNQRQAGIAAVLFGLVDLAGDVTEWLASVLQVSKEEFENPDLFPLPAHVDILMALVDHPDIEAFVGKLEAVAKDETRMGRILTLLGSTPSTPSKADTDGQTSTSSEPSSQEENRGSLTLVSSS